MYTYYLAGARWTSLYGLTSRLVRSMFLLTGIPLVKQGHVGDHSTDLQQDLYIQCFCVIPSADCIIMILVYFWCSFYSEGALTKRVTCVT